MNDLYLVADGALREIKKRRAKVKYLEDPGLWAEDYLGIQLWSRQKEIAYSVVQNKNVVVKAGHEVGKSWLAGLLICWWIDTHWDLPGGCFVVSTAPSVKQINAVVWKEVRLFFQLAKDRFQEEKVDHPLPGYITSDATWKLDNGVEIGYGRKPPDAGKDADQESAYDTMSGIHARFVLAVGDEASSLPKGLIGALGNITSNATSRRFLICNPTNPLSYIASLFKNKPSNWAMHTISVFDSPNFHGAGRCWEGCEHRAAHAEQPFGEGFPDFILEKLVDTQYPIDMAEEHGIDSPTYISRVLGEFAWDMGFTLIRPEDIAKGLDTDIVPSLTSGKVIAADFSRSKAGDKNTVYSFHNGKLRFIEEWNEANAMNTARKVVEIALDQGAVEVRGDGQGLGGPIMDRIAELSENRFLVIPIDSSWTSPDNRRWYNYRAYMYWSFQDALSKEQIDIDPEDEKLQTQLMGIELKKRVSGADSILLESKEEMRKRGVHSPDHADSAVMASLDLEWLTGNPINALPVGSIVSQGRDEIVDLGVRDYIRLPGRSMSYG